MNIGEFFFIFDVKNRSENKKSKRTKLMIFLRIYIKGFKKSPIFAKFLSIYIDYIKILQSDSQKVPKLGYSNQMIYFN